MRARNSTYELHRQTTGDGSPGYTFDYQQNGLVNVFDSWATLHKQSVRFDRCWTKLNRYTAIKTEIVGTSPLPALPCPPPPPNIQPQQQQQQQQQQQPSPPPRIEVANGCLYLFRLTSPLHIHSQGRLRKLVVLKNEWGSTVASTNGLYILHR